MYQGDDPNNRTPRRTALLLAHCNATYQSLSHRTGLPLRLCFSRLSCNDGTVVYRNVRVHRCITSSQVQHEPTQRPTSCKSLLRTEFYPDFAPRGFLSRRPSCVIPPLPAQSSHAKLRQPFIVRWLRPESGQQALAWSQRLGRIGRPPGQIRGMLHPGAYSPWPSYRPSRPGQS